MTGTDGPVARAEGPVTGPFPLFKLHEALSHCHRSSVFFCRGSRRFSRKAKIIGWLDQRFVNRRLLVLATSKRRKV